MGRSVSKAQLAAVELERRRRARMQIEMPAEALIPGDMTFTQWVEKLGDAGLKVDGIKFSLKNRPAMRFVYDLIPSRWEDAYKQIIVLQKCAQVGFTVLEMLATIYFALKWAPCKIGMYLPDMKLAGAKSDVRFMPIVRTIPEAYKVLTDGRASEGNIMIRQMGASRFHFLWTSGKAMTESFPLDVLTFDEVQEMAIEDMEKTEERLSASHIRFIMMGSTANYPDSDINWYYKKGCRYRFHTRCPSCQNSFIFDDHFPKCIGWDDVSDDYCYVCPHCEAKIEDAQNGEWVAEDPSNKRIISIHFTQFLSPTISPREMIEAYYNAADLKNFYNRKLGKPYVDPRQMPVTLDMLNDCASQGVAAGVVWKTFGKQTFMGIDNMGGFSCALITERLEDGRMAVIHAEAIYSLDPWQRLDELMDSFDVAVCVCEQLPNYDSAKQFASRHKGRVFLVASYTNIDDDMLRWGDASVSKADMKTSSEYRDRYTVTIDQYKMMSWALARFGKQTTVFPDPGGLTQVVSGANVKKTGIAKKLDEKGEHPVAIARDVLFHHLVHIALVTETSDEEHKIKRKVVKVGLDPHFAFAYMMCCTAWCRAYGTTQFILPTKNGDDQRRMNVESNMPGLPEGVLQALETLPQGEVCGRCVSFDANTASCKERGFLVRPSEPGCHMFLPPDEN